VGNRVSLSSGSTGMQYAQIQCGAPFDLFFAAGSVLPQLLEMQGYTVLLFFNHLKIRVLPDLLKSFFM
jgi:ABC-type molybdate transport system substrate-binding protein